MRGSAERSLNKIPDTDAKTVDGNSQILCLNFGKDLHLQIFRRFYISNIAVSGMDMEKRSITIVVARLLST